MAGGRGVRMFAPTSLRPILAEKCAVKVVKNSQDAAPALGKRPA